MENDNTVRSRTWAGVKGSTTINHRLRIIYNLSYPEYVILDCIQQHNEKNFGKPFSEEYLWKMTGYKRDDHFEGVVDLLIAKGLLVLYTDAGKIVIPRPTSEWLKNFDLTADFEEFWAAYGRIGNKEKAKGAYVRARKTVDKETLHDAAKKYIANLGETFPLHASTYLNPKNKHWEDVVVAKKKTVTRQDTAGQFNLETF